jgi:hypothetical protein
MVVSQNDQYKKQFGVHPARASANPKVEPKHDAQNYRGYHQNGHKAKEAIGHAQETGINFWIGLLRHIDKNAWQIKESCKPRSD